MKDRFQKVADLEIDRVPDGYVIYQASRDRVHFLNATAAAILELCDGQHSLEDIMSVIVAAYELENRPDEEFEGSVSNMIAEGLIAPCEK